MPKMGGERYMKHQIVINVVDENNNKQEVLYGGEFTQNYHILHT